STSEQQGVNISTSEQQGVNISTSEQQGVNISTSEQQGVNISTSEQQGVSNRDMVDGKQQGVNDSTNPLHPVNDSTSKQQGVNISSNTTNEQHPLSNTTNNNTPTNTCYFTDNIATLTINNTVLYLPLNKEGTNLYTFNTSLLAIEITLSELKRKINIYNPVIIKNMTEFKITVGLSNNYNDILTPFSNSTIITPFNDSSLLLKGCYLLLQPFGYKQGNKGVNISNINNTPTSIYFTCNDYRAMHMVLIVDVIQYKCSDSNIGFSIGSGDSSMGLGIGSGVSSMGGNNTPLNNSTVNTPLNNSTINNTPLNKSSINTPLTTHSNNTLFYILIYPLYYLYNSTPYPLTFSIINTSLNCCTLLTLSPNNNVSLPYFHINNTAYISTIQQDNKSNILTHDKYYINNNITYGLYYDKKVLNIKGNKIYSLITEITVYPLFICNNYLKVEVSIGGNSIRGVKDSSRLEGVSNSRDKVSSVKGVNNSRDKVSSVKGVNNSRDKVSSVKGVNNSRDKVSSVKGVNNSRDKVSSVKGVNNSRDKVSSVKGVNNSRDKVSSVKGVSNTRDKVSSIRGVSNTKDILEGVSNIVDIQQGVKDKTYDNTYDNTACFNLEDRKCSVRCMGLSSDRLDFGVPEMLCILSVGKSKSRERVMEYERVFNIGKGDKGNKDIKGVSNIVDIQQGVKDRGSNIKGVNSSIDDYKGVSNSTNKQQGVNISTIKQQGVNNLSNEQQGVNISTDVQQGVNNNNISTNKQHPLNNNPPNNNNNNNTNINTNITPLTDLLPLNNRLYLTPCYLSLSIEMVPGKGKYCKSRIINIRYSNILKNNTCYSLIIISENYVMDIGCYSSKEIHLYKNNGFYILFRKKVNNTLLSSYCSYVSVKPVSDYIRIEGVLFKVEVTLENKQRVLSIIEVYNYPYYIVNCSKSVIYYKQCGSKEEYTGCYNYSGGGYSNDGYRGVSNSNDGYRGVNDKSN
ncbi:hypothetical protein CWI39_1907p0010, partial [Hamiltosporidium magnivora]